MTDNETIKALKCCIESNTVLACEGCPLCNTRQCIGNPKTYVSNFIVEQGIDLINRQKAELEKKDVEIDILIRKKETLKDEVSELRAEVERLQKANESFSCLGMLYSEIKSEARKEFAERLKLMAEKISIAGIEYQVITTESLDNLLAEMESEGK